MIDFDGVGVLASEVQCVWADNKSHTTIAFKNKERVTVEFPYQEVFELVNGNIPLNTAAARARDIFDRWNKVTGFFPQGGGYYREMLGLLEDAVTCGFQAARNQYEQLEAEKDVD